MSGEQPGESSSVQLLKIAVIVVALAGAVFFLWRSRSEEEGQPDTAESAVTYICIDDGHTFEVTPAGFKRMSEEGKVKSSEADSELGGGVVLLICPTSGQSTAVRAIQCPHDQTWFARRLPDRTVGKCPRCGWSLYPR